MVEEEQILLDVMKRYESIDIPLSSFVELAPPLQPRYYSISSSNRVRRLCSVMTVARETCELIHITTGLSTKHPPNGRPNAA
jgi:sulfite reductase alpha subunit-like flavoprotein